MHENHSITQKHISQVTSWQKLHRHLLEQDTASGVVRHPKAEEQKLKTSEQSPKERLSAIQRLVASWYVQSDGKFIDTQNKEIRLGLQEIYKIVPIRLAAAFPGNPLVEKNFAKFTEAAVFGNSPDPRFSFGVYSGKAYPVPGNISRRIFNQGLWDINTWQSPSYRYLQPSHNSKAIGTPFEDMLEFAIPERAERDMLLDWISWNLQNEHTKPTWSILLFSEAKGTGKSTIGEVLTALFGLDNTANLNGIKNLTQRFSADALAKKLVVAEEVHISSHSTDGNALKDLITNNTVSVEPKYQPVVSIPQRSCFLFTTNHKPLWLEGGERRYFIIDMDHDGHAQGSQNDEFVESVAKVKAMIEDPQALRDLYERLVVRKQSERFDPKNMRFNVNATPIMRELQATCGNEGDEVLKSLLKEYKVRIIHSKDFVELTAYLRLRNANALRNTLSRLGWQADRLRLKGRQHRVWIAEGTRIEDGRVQCPELAKTYDKLAVELGYTWFEVAFFVHTTWNILRAERLNKAYGKSLETYSAFDTGPYENSNGEFGPYNGSRSHLIIQARRMEIKFAQQQKELDDDMPRI